MPSILAFALLLCSILNTASAQPQNRILTVQVGSTQSAASDHIHADDACRDAFRQALLKLPELGNRVCKENFGSTATCVNCGTNPARPPELAPSQSSNHSEYGCNYRQEGRRGNTSYYYYSASASGLYQVVCVLPD